MPRGKKPSDPTVINSNPDRRPALTPEARENAIISAAYDLAEQQIKDGTVSAQVLSHFLKLGSEKERLERELLAGRTRLANAKVDSIDREKDQAEAYERAMNAMKIYNGEPVEDTDDIF